MTDDPATILAEIDAFGIMLDHYLRRVEITGDKRTCAQIVGHTERMLAASHRTYVKIKQQGTNGKQC